MAMRIGSSRRKTRKLFSIPESRKGRVSIRNYLQSFETGDKVTIGIDPSVHRALPFRRFIGRAGMIVGTQGEVYRVRIKDGGNEKTLLIHPAHLRRMKV